MEMCQTFSQPWFCGPSRKISLCSIIVNRQSNGYETVGNIKVVSTDNFKQLEVANKVNIASGSTQYFYFIRRSNLEEQITHLFSEVSVFIFKFEQKITNQALNMLNTCTIVRGNFERFHVCFLV